MSNKILYDLGVSLGSVSLWLTPFDVTRVLGYSLSVVFAGRAYYTGLITLQAERKNEEKEGITYEADVDFYDQLLGANADAQLELRTLQVENAKLQQLIPLVRVNQQLQQLLDKAYPVHPEMTDSVKEQAARQAIDNAFVGDKKEAIAPPQITEEDIRKQFPESMDATSWKAILKALQNGASKDEIVKDVLGCGNTEMGIGKAYYELLKTKFA
jgi:hypothetical protein